MKYTKTLDLLVQAAVFQAAGKTENAAKFFSAACAQKDTASVITVLSNASQKAFEATQTASGKKSLASLLAEIAAKKKAKKVVKKKVKASEDGEDDMDSILDDMTEASDEETDFEDDDLSDLDSMLENEMPEAGTDEADDKVEDNDTEEVEMAKVSRVRANVDALNRIKASSK